jgi:hypothetical protein
VHLLVFHAYINEMHGSRRKKKCLGVLGYTPVLFFGVRVCLLSGCFFGVLPDVQSRVYVCMCVCVYVCVATLPTCTDMRRLNDRDTF